MKANPGIVTTSPSQALHVVGNINVSSPGNIYYDGALVSYSPMVVESGDGKPIPICMKADNGKWVGCMPVYNSTANEYKWTCGPNAECDEELAKR